ncbi:MAG TPA: DUF305 domain-containing protein [Jatrophihabitans sp.]|nr:DUF305 domain-containing protein [Jatrophihabitans sp.]
MAAMGLLIAGALAVAGCSAAGSTGDSRSTAASASSSSIHSAQFNRADVDFVQRMIPHHQGALEMADLAAGRGQDQRVKDFAERIKFAEDLEIETMTGWLDDWGKTTSLSADTGGMDLSTLQAASGRDFDRMWLKMLSEHHVRAVAMANAEIASGDNQHALALATQIVDTQGGEVQEVQSLLTELGG